MLFCAPVCPNGSNGTSALTFSAPMLVKTDVPQDRTGERDTSSMLLLFLAEKHILDWTNFLVLTLKILEPMLGLAGNPLNLWEKRSKINCR